MSIGQAINPVPGACIWFLPKFISLAQIVPGRVHPPSDLKHHYSVFMHCYLYILIHQWISLIMHNEMNQQQLEPLAHTSVNGRHQRWIRIIRRSGSRIHVMIPTWKRPGHVMLLRSSIFPDPMIRCHFWN